jgi:hypothetical protein
MRISSRFVALCACLVAVAALTAVTAQTPVGRAGQAARQIPGITTKDTFPNGCVDCHTSASPMGDTRMSTMLTKWATAVDAPLLAKAKASMVDPSKVKGKHPTVPRPGANVPQGCLAACHKKGSTLAPPFVMLVHAIHLTGAQNRFLTEFQGECTHCHKLDQKTGAWRIPSGPEK